MANLYLNKINRRVQECGTTIPRLAIQIGVKPQTIYNIIKRNSTTFDMIERISEALDVPVTYFMSETEDLQEDLGGYRYLTAQKGEDGLPVNQGDTECIKQSGSRREPRFKSTEELLSYRQYLIDERDKEIAYLKKEMEVLKVTIESKNEIIDILKQQVDMLKSTLLNR